MFFRYVRFLSLFLILFSFWSCSNKNNKDQIVQPEKVVVSIPGIHELNSPIYLNFNQNIIPEENEVSDYLKKRKKQETTDNSDSSAISVSNEEIISEINRIKTDIISKVTFIPPLKGDFEWESNRVLKFVPEKNQIGWGARIYVNINPVIPFFGEQFTSSSISRTLELPQYQVGSKAANWDTILGAPRFIAPLGYKAYAHLIGKGAYYLLYDQPLDLELIRQHLRLTKGDKSELSYTLKHPDNIGNEFNLDIDDNYVVSIYINEALEEGERLYLSIPSWKELPESGNPQFQSYYLTYKSYFNLKDVYYENKLSSGRVELDSNIILNFSSDFNLSEFRDRFSIYPAPQDMNIYSYNSNSVYLDLNLDPGIEYNMTLDEDFTDYLNNKLDSPFSVTFRAQDLVPVFTIPNKPITVESGNKSIPFKGINIESVQLNV
ncbi:MAG: Ig-like domain-containing protein, partial [Deltaproteobacteria bacterium]|nr:Ig-like domain-containing protein [Deltaproteobacteria bacterium]